MLKSNASYAAMSRKNDKMVKNMLKSGKKGSWKDTWTKFVEQMKIYNLRIKDVAADGNCLFRSFADQMAGDDSMHDYYRQKTCDFMEANPDDYAPFIDGDFKNYCKQMRKNGIWGGNIELQALSMAFSVNITIHQLEDPRFEIVNSFEKNSKMIHLSYHDGQHYCSVRNSGDFSGPAEKIKIEAVNSVPVPGPYIPKELSKEEKTVIGQTQCNNLEIVQSALRENDYNVDATVEYIINMLACDEDDQFSDCKTHQNKEKEEAEFVVITNAKHNTNKCDCGSGKSAKNCCLVGRNEHEKKLLAKDPAKLTNKERKELLKLEKDLNSMSKYNKRSTHNELNKITDSIASVAI